MTLREKMAEVKPDEINEMWIGGVFGCPFGYDFLGVKKECPYPKSPVCEINCRKCWNRKYIEPEVQDE